MSEHDQPNALEKTWDDIDAVYAALLLDGVWRRHVLADRTSEFCKDASLDLILQVRAIGASAVEAQTSRRNVGPVLATETISYDSVPDLARQLEGIYGGLVGDA